MLFGFLESAVVLVVALKQSAQLVTGPGAGQLHPGIVCAGELGALQTGVLLNWILLSVF